MRLYSAIGTAFLIFCAMPAASRADEPQPAASIGSTQAPAPDCKCPGMQHRHAWQPRRHVRHHARSWQHGPPPVAIAPFRPYDPPIPSPWDSAYDRAMTLHFRSVEVSGIHIAEPGFPATPPVRGVLHYRVQNGGAVVQYDGLTGQYIQLAQGDALRAFPPPPAPAPAPR